MPPAAAGGAPQSYTTQRSASRLEASSPCIARSRKGSSVGRGASSRRLLPPPCGEARSANRTRWSGGDTGHLQTPAPDSSKLEAAQPLRRSLTSFLDATDLAAAAASRAEARRDVAQLNAMGTAGNQLAVTPPIANGNATLAMDIPATTADAAALVRSACRHPLLP